MMIKTRTNFQIIRRGRTLLVSALFLSFILHNSETYSKQLNYQEATDIVKEQQDKKIKITGTVYDSSKEPIIGAVVNVKGTREVAMTDADGKFTL